jgi:hypothetical protein
MRPLAGTASSAIISDKLMFIENGLEELIASVSNRART